MKVALVLDDDVAGARASVSVMLAAQRHEPNCGTRLLPFTFGCLGLLGRPEEDESSWPVWTGQDGSFLAFSGVPLPGDGTKTLDSAHPVVRAALGEQLEQRGTGASDGLAALDGAWVAVWWDARAARLTVLTDFLGMQPLYRRSEGARTLFASELKALAQAGVGAPEPDAGAWGAMLLFGHQIGPRTLLSGSTRVAEATAIAFEGSNRETRWTTWEWPAERATSATAAVVDDIGDALSANVAAYAAAHPRASLLFSGGFDSRLILCLCRELGLSPRLLLHRHPDENADADARFAIAFARELGVRPQVTEARASYFGTADYLRFLERNEVATPSLGLFIANVAPIVRAERNGVWEGMMLDPALKFGRVVGGLAGMIEARVGARSTFRTALRRAFTPTWAARVEADFEALLAEEQSRFPADAGGAWRFSVLNRSRFRTGVNPYQVYDTTTPPLTPGMSRAMWDMIGALAPEARYDGRLYREVFARLAPAGLRQPVVSGASLHAGTGGTTLYRAQRLRIAAQRLVQRPRISRALGAVGLPTPFAWTRSAFVDVALAEASLDDGRLNADWLRGRSGSGDLDGADGVVGEVVLYWRAWNHVMRGGLVEAWGSGGEGA